MNRIVITACSRRKTTCDDNIPAIERYDGPSFRLLRKYLRHSEHNVDIYILSAKFGLISYLTEIPFYEQALYTAHIGDLMKLVTTQANQIFSHTSKSNEVFVNLGKAYLHAFEPALKEIRTKDSLVLATGPSGRRLSELHDWLYGERSVFRNHDKNHATKSEVVIKGISVRARESKISEIVERGIGRNQQQAISNFQSWFVPVGKLKVSPKWLVSQLTGLSVSEFHSDQARKVLHKLGIAIRRL